MRSVVVPRGLTLAALWLGVAGFACTQEALPLKHGSYVERGTACKDAPFAAMKNWDGNGIGDPHSSGCTLRVLRQSGNRYRVTDTCTAQGDGTLASPDVERATLTLLGAQSFRYSRQMPGGNDATVYRWCAAQ